MTFSLHQLLMRLTGHTDVKEYPIEIILASCYCNLVGVVQIQGTDTSASIKMMFRIFLAAQFI